MTSDKVSHNFEKLIEGDQKAFTFFYKHFINDMYAYGMSLGADDKYIMDAIQDVFLKVFLEKIHFSSVQHFKYFLLKSLKNRLYDIFKAKSFSETADINSDVLTFSIKTTVLDDIIEDEDRIIIQRKVEELLSVLSPLQKEALYLRYIQEMEYADISNILNRTEASIRQLVSQAIQKIKKENKILPITVFIRLLYGAF